MIRSLLCTLLFCITLNAEEALWSVLLDTIYFPNNNKVNSLLNSLNKDSLTFFEYHYCEDIESREFFNLLDSLVPGVYVGDPEAHYSDDSLPAVHYSIWLAIGDSLIAHTLLERYGGRLVKDTQGSGPGLRGEWNLAVPKLFQEEQQALLFIKNLKKEFEISTLKFALLSNGEYLFFGSCLSKKEADDLVELLWSKKIKVRAIRIFYQHIDL